MERECALVLMHTFSFLLLCPLLLVLLQCAVDLSDHIRLFLCKLYNLFVIVAQHNTASFIVIHSLRQLKKRTHVSISNASKLLSCYSRLVSRRTLLRPSS